MMYIHIYYSKTYLMMFKPTAKGRYIRLNITTLKIVYFDTLSVEGLKVRFF